MYVQFFRDGNLMYMVHIDTPPIKTYLEATLCFDLELKIFNTYMKLSLFSND